MFNLLQFLLNKTVKEEDVKTLFKVYYDYDLVFHHLAVDSINVNSVFEEKELYDFKIKGLTSFLMFDNINTKNWYMYSEIEYSKLKNNQRIAVLYFKNTFTYNTKAVLNVQNRVLCKVVYYFFSKTLKIKMPYKVLVVSK